MRTYTVSAHLRTALNKERALGKKVAFVPTMGNLHEGHLSLVRKARQLADVVVVSIFVNPLQFGENEDLDAYPRTFAADREKLFAEGTQYLFHPDVAEVYPDGMATQSLVHVPNLGEGHCGGSRPGHFDGVSTVVSKLFNLVQPDIAVFGEKDFQQLAIIRKMTRDLCMPIEIVGVATARAEDGLALSSRNGYLSRRDRVVAPRLQQVLRATRDAIASGFDSYNFLEKHGREALDAAGLRPDYFNICDAKTLKTVTIDTQEIVILAAAFLGDTRLIDNITVNIDGAMDWDSYAPTGKAALHSRSGSVSQR